MKYTVQFTMGHVGYFLIMFMALKSMVIEGDAVTFIVLFLGALSLISYVQFLEKRHGAPKHGGFIKLILVILFLTSGLTMLFY